MLFGKPINKNLSALLWLLLIIASCQSFAACQKIALPDVAETLEQCQQLLASDDVIPANDCYGKAVINYPGETGKIAAVRDQTMLDKCVELKNAKKYEPAIVCLEGMTVYLADKSSVYIYLANAYLNYYKSGKIKDDSLTKAEDAVKKAIQLRPESAIAHDTYGLILEQKGDFQNALEEHRKSVRLEPKDGLYWVTLALSQEKVKDTDGAFESYENALKIDPNDVDALYFLSELYEKTGKIEEAVQTIERRNKIEPPNEETLRKLKELKARIKSDKSGRT